MIIWLSSLLLRKFHEKEKGVTVMLKISAFQSPSRVPQTRSSHSKWVESLNKYISLLRSELPGFPYIVILSQSCYWQTSWWLRAAPFLLIGRRNEDDVIKLAFFLKSKIRRPYGYCKESPRRWCGRMKQRKTCERTIISAQHLAINSLCSGFSPFL